MVDRLIITDVTNYSYGSKMTPSVCRQNIHVVA